MLEWITEIEKKYPSNNENGQLSIKRFNSTVELNEMSSVCQFFASFDVILDENALTVLPTPNDKALNIIMNEVVPHYIDVKQIFIDGKLKEINVRGLKEESKKIVKDLFLKGGYPVMLDLYRTNNLNLATGPRNLKHYLIKQQSLSPLHLSETETIREFLESTFFAEKGSIMLQPTGWKLDDTLKESVTIRAFSTFAKQIVLVVDDKDKSVVGLNIYG
jgi:hypothetical protein